MQYIGFDLGDGESCLCFSNGESPLCIPVSGKISFLSAVGYIDNSIVIGDVAVNQNVRNTHVCFKRYFLEDSNIYNELIRDFVKGIMYELRNSMLVSELADDPEKLCYVVGCPAGWDENSRNRYRDIMISAGMKNVRIVSESRAAFINACRNRIIESNSCEDNVLLIDFGSSTLDFAYTHGGNQYKTSTMGNIILGGGIIDEMIVDYALEKLKETDPDNASFIYYLTQSNPTQKSKLMVEARKIKEMYFKNEESGMDEADNQFKTPVRIFSNGRVFVVPVYISAPIVEDYIMRSPCRMLDNQSIESRIKDCLLSVHSKMKTQPEIVILTGGASRMRFFRAMCKEEFVNSFVVFSNTPESDIAMGLAEAGICDSKMRVLNEEIRKSLSLDDIRKTVEARMPELIDAISDPVSEAVCTNIIEPLFNDWNSGTEKFTSFNELNYEINRSLQSYINSDEFKAILNGCTKMWSENIISEIQTKLDSLCSENGINCMYLKFDRLDFSLLNPDYIDLDYSMVDVIHAILAAITSALLAMLCGGTGIALLASGPVGIILGAVIGISASCVLKKPAEKRLKNINILPLNFVNLIKGRTIGAINIERNIKKNRNKIVSKFRKSISENKKLADNLTSQISAVISKTILAMTEEIQRNL